MSLTELAAPERIAHHGHGRRVGRIVFRNGERSTGRQHDSEDAEIVSGNDLNLHLASVGTESERMRLTAIVRCEVERRSARLNRRDHRV